ncbi:MAG: hypothetical protein ACUVS6_02345 [Anaerolineae bacterium]
MKEAEARAHGLEPMQQFARALWLPLLVVALALPALQPLWQPGLQQTDDGMHHLSRLFGLDQAFRAGHPGTRWLADEGFGYGFPVLNFYAPLTYYVGMLWRWAGLGLVTTLEWLLAAGLVLSALTMYLFARRLLGDWGGALAAVAYVWAPYHLADAWTRGALAELWAFVWFPLLLLALWEIARQRGRARLLPVLWGGAALGGLVLTHNLSVLLAAPVLIGWGVFILLLEVRELAARWQGLRGYMLMVVLGLLLSAAFWLPALVEARYIWASRVPMSVESWQSQLVHPGLLVSQWWTQRYAMLEAVGTQHPMGQAQLLLALIGVGGGAWYWRSMDRLARWGLLLFGSLAALALFMQTIASVGIWRAIPGLLLLQFPWRWQAVTVLAFALLTGYTALALEKKLTLNTHLSSEILQRREDLLLAALVIVAALVLMSSGLPHLKWICATYPTSEQLADNATVDHRAIALYDFGRGLLARQFYIPWIFEYMPVWVQVPREEFFLPVTDPQPQAGGTPLAVQLMPGRQAPLERRFTAVSETPWTLQLHQFYFPGWQASISGHPVPAAPIGPLALAGVQVPAGQHEVVFRFGTTPPRQIGWALTLAGLGAWLAALLWLRQWRALAALAIAALLFGGLGLAQRRAHPTDYAPVNLNVNFDDQAQLTGYHLAPDALQPGGDGTVTLHWLALRQPVRDYKVFLHLVDPTGKLWAQHDGQPGDWFSPTTRWQPGEFLEDRHVLEWHARPPAGRYLLFAGLYDAQTGVRLPTYEVNGTPIGDQVLLGEFEITP